MSKESLPNKDRNEYSTLYIEDITLTLFSFWLEDSLDKGELCPIDYYHRPIEHLEGDDQCCQGVVICISTYSGRERQFLQLAAESMGMISQEVFAKKDKKEAKRSTHLVCSGVNYWL